VLCQRTCPPVLGVAGVISRLLLSHGTTNEGKSLRTVIVIAGLLLLCTQVLAQDQPEHSTSGASSHSASSPHERCGLKKLDQCLKDLAHDQAGIWTSPLRVNSHDAIWLVSFVGATGAAFAYDQDALRQVGTTNKSLTDKSETVSEFGSPYATFGEAGALYLFGALKHDDHLRETGLLGAEAVADASLVAGGLKLSTNRERPNEGIGTGRFWPHGTRDYSLDSSFPSGHAAASWALARVIAAEYPGWLTKLGAYGFATAISASRITARQHFPSDVVVGSTFGFLIGGYVVRHHSSAFQDESSYTLLPIFDRSQHAYGLTVAFTPRSEQMQETVHRLRKLSLLFDRK
jgi:membrane-associated phospholipid phosphatase